MFTGLFVFRSTLSTTYYSLKQQILLKGNNQINMMYTSSLVVTKLIYALSKNPHTCKNKFKTTDILTFVHKNNIPFVIIMYNLYSYITKFLKDKRSILFEPMLLYSLKTNFTQKHIVLHVHVYVPSKCASYICKFNLLQKPSFCRKKITTNNNVSVYKVGFRKASHTLFFHKLIMVS